MFLVYLQKVGFQKPSPDRTRRPGFHSYQTYGNREQSPLHRVSAYTPHALSKLEVPTAADIHSTHGKMPRHSTLHATPERPMSHNPGLISSIASQGSRSGKIFPNPLIICE